MRPSTFCRSPCRRRALATLAALAAAPLLPACGGGSGSDAPPPPPPSAASVPPEFAALYAELERLVADATAYWRAKPAAGRPTAWSAALLSANTNLGRALLAPGALASSRLLLDSLRRLGFTQVNVDIQVPFLLPKIGADMAGYRAFYRALLPEIRARGMRVEIEMGTTFNDTFSDVVFDYRGQPYPVLREDVRAQAEWIAAELAPDALSILNEPDTQQKNTGIALPAPAWADLVGTAARSARLRAPSLPLGAGSGTWNAAQYVDALVALPELDYLNLHVYPVQNGWAAAALDAVTRVTATARKEVGIGEAWLYKAATHELGGDIASAAGVFARDVFSFWQPLDIAFLQLMGHFARAAGPRFVNFFWTRNFYGAVDYDETTRSLAPAELFRRMAAVAGENVARDRPNAVGLAAADVIAGRF